MPGCSRCLRPPPHSLHWRRRRPCSQMLEPPHALHWFRLRPCSQMRPPPHSLHCCRCRPCSQMLAPPHGLQMLRTRPCSQMPAPPHSLHRYNARPCAQMPEPPHALQMLRTRPCSQMLGPPQSLHWCRWRPCSQMLEPPHSLHRLCWRLCSQMLAPPHPLHWCRCRPCSQMLAPPHSLHCCRWRPCSQMREPPHGLQMLRWRPCSQRHFLPSEMHRRCSPFGNPGRPVLVTRYNTPFGHLEANGDGAGGGCTLSPAEALMPPPSGTSDASRCASACIASGAGTGVGRYTCGISSTAVDSTSTRALAHTPRRRPGPQQRQAGSPTDLQAARGHPPLRVRDCDVRVGVPDYRIRVCLASPIGVRSTPPHVHPAHGHTVFIRTARIECRSQTRRSTRRR